MLTYWRLAQLNCLAYHLSNIFYIFKSNMNMSFKQMTDNEVGNINQQ